MFREKLHKDLAGISPDEELLTNITKMMQEEALRPRPKTYQNVIRYCGMAAAVCMIAVGAFAVTSDNLKAGDAADMTVKQTLSGASVNNEYALCEEEADTEISVDGTVYFAEYSDGAENKSVGFTSCKAVKLGESIDLDEETADKLFNIILDYIADNPNQALNLAMTHKQYTEFGETGIFAEFEYSGDKKAAALIDGKSSYASDGGSFYWLSGKAKDEIEAVFAEQ